MQEKMLKSMLYSTCIFFCVCMGVMLYFASTKTIVIAEEAKTETGANHSTIKEGNELYFAREDAGTTNLIIPLPDEVRADDIVIENRYAEHALHIFLSGEYDAFYETHALSGNYAHIKEGTYWTSAEGVHLLLVLDSLLETDYVFENGSLTLGFSYPVAGKEKLVVLDPAHGGEDVGMFSNGLVEKEVTLKIAELVRKHFEKSDVRIILSRTDDSVLEPLERISLANDLKADMFICIDAASNRENDKVYGMQAFFNGNYFIPYFNGVDLADLLEKETTASTGARANGIFAAQPDNELLMNTRVPAAVLEVGYLTNTSDAGKLSNDEYLGTVADGICKAIEKAYVLKENNQ